MGMFEEIRPEDIRYEIRYVKIPPEEMQSRIDELINEKQFLESGLCALINELEKRGIAPEVITSATESSVFNIVDFWDNHANSNESKVAVKLLNLNDHERMIMKNILNRM